MHVSTSQYMSFAMYIGQCSFLVEPGPLWIKDFWIKMFISLALSSDKNSSYLYKFFDASKVTWPIVDKLF